MPDLDLKPIMARYSKALDAKPGKGPISEAGIIAITDSVCDVPELLAEVERLARWKSEALPVMDGLQELGKALNLPLGARITGPMALAEIERLRDEVRNAKADGWDERDKARAQYLGPDHGHYEGCMGYEDCYCGTYPNPYRDGAAGRLTDPETAPEPTSGAEVAPEDTQKACASVKRAVSMTIRCCLPEGHADFHRSFGGGYSWTGD